MARYLGLVLVVLSVASDAASELSFEIGTCYEAWFCGLLTGRNVACPDTEPDVMGQCIRVRYKVAANGEVTNLIIGNNLSGVVGAGMFVAGCATEGGGSANYRSGLVIVDRSIGPDGITGKASFFGTDGEPEFEEVTGNITGNSFTMTISGGVEGTRFENHVFEFESTFCDQVDCGNCESPWLQSDPPETEPETLIFWDNDGGDFEVPENWEPEQVPGANDTAVFADPFQVTISQATTRSASVRAGTVTFFEGSYELTGTSLGDTRSLRVGDNPGEVSVLRLQDHALTSVHSAIGRASGSNGTVRMEEATSSWTNTGRLSVGLAGEGTLLLSNGAQLTSTESRIGDEQNGVGLVSVDFGANTTDGRTEWDAGNLAVGIDGEGTLNINGGAVFAQDVAVGSAGSGTGFLTIDGATAPGYLSAGALNVGGEDSYGEVFVMDGGRVDVAFGVTITSSSDQAESSLTVSGRSASRNVASTLETLSEEIRIGVGNGGNLIIEDGAFVRSGSGFVGVGANGGIGYGGAVVTDATWVLDGTLFVGEASGPLLVDVTGHGTVFLLNGEINADEIFVDTISTIWGSGLLVADSVVNSGGTIRPDVLLTVPEEKKAAEVTKQQSAVLTIDGDLLVEDGALELDMRGPQEDAVDRIVVTGDATLTRPVVRINFVDGYLPTTGETAPLIAADGAVGLTGATLEYSGVADGFDYRLVEQGGTLAFEALNDAQVAAEGEGEGEGETPPSTCAGGTAAPPANGDVLLAVLLGLALISVATKSSRRHYPNPCGYSSTGRNSVAGDGARQEGHLGFRRGDE